MKRTSKLIIDDLLYRYPILKTCEVQIISAIDELIKCYSTNHKLLVCGNGGSSSDALHIVGELMKSFKVKRSMDDKVFNNLKELFPNEANGFNNVIEGALESHALVNEVALLTAFSNDKSGEYSYAQQVYGLGKRDDILLSISTSGNSRNVVLASQMAKAKNMNVIVLTGSEECQLDTIADIIIHVPSDEVYIIQELHLPIYHAICLALENEFWGLE